MGLGAEAALAAAERFIVRARWLSCVVPLFAAPAALWCARMMVLSMKTMPSAGQPAAFYTKVATRTVHTVTSPLDKLVMFRTGEVAPDG